jgi:hypothetical protein
MIAAAASASSVEIVGNVTPAGFQPWLGVGVLRRYSKIGNSWTKPILE